MKRGNKIIKRTINTKLYIKYKILNLYIFFIIIYLSKGSFSFKRQLNLDSEITITIKGNGTQNILSSRFNHVPSEILINGVKTKKLGYKVYNLKQQENNITIKWNYSLTNCSWMFFNLNNILKIDFSNFDSSQVIDVNHMFCFCDSLTSIEFGNFITSSIKNMRNMFRNCTSLTSLNLSSFDTSLVTNMYGLFCFCDSLLSVDLSNFNTSSVINMNGIFFGCSSLTSLDISYFDTSLVTDMYAMFAYCNLLTSINLSNFNTMSSKNLRALFYGCTSLISLDLSNFNTSSVINMAGMFFNCISLKTLNLSSFNTSSATSMESMFFNCKSLISLDLSNFNTSSVTNMRSMFSKCSSLMFLNFNNFDTLSVTNMTNILYGCNNDLIYCINYQNNKTNNFLKEFELSNYSFHNNCSHLCHIEKKKYISVNEKCIDNCYNDDIYQFEYNNICYDSCPTGTISYNKDNLCEININYFNDLCKTGNNITRDIILQNIRNELTNNNLDLLIEKIIEENKKDLISFQNNIVYQITSPYNQKNNEYNNISTINLDECEKQLRMNYNISNNKTLLIIKVDIFEEEYLIPITEYEIYNSNTKDKLDLSICKDTKINISIPVSIDENNLFKYNISSEYYNDICFPYTTENKTDITLKDRRTEFVENNMSLCEKNCDYKEYNFNNKKVKCECLIKINFTSLSGTIINKEKLLNNFLDIKNKMNIHVIKCYKIAFTKEGLNNNIGNFILLSIIFLQIICVTYFILKGYPIFKKKTIYAIIKYKNEKENNNNNDINALKDTLSNNNINKLKLRNKDIIKEDVIQKIKEDNKKNNKDIYKMSKFYNKTEVLTSKINILNHKNNHISLFNFRNKNTIHNKNVINFNHYNDFELNNLPYEEALNIDKRSYFQYYCSLLKMKHLLIFTFYTYTDYNLRIIKISLFLFSFAFYYTINALFFNDSTIHQIYKDKGSFNFIYHFLQIFYSSIISFFINSIIKYLSLTENDITKIKKEKSDYKQKAYEIIIFLNIKFTLYFIINFLFTFFFWFYLSCFCAIYKNSQIHLIKYTLISFGISLLYPLVINLIPGALRIPSLKAVKKDQKWLYKSSQVIQLL